VLDLGQALELTVAAPGVEFMSGEVRRSLVAGEPVDADDRLGAVLGSLVVAEGLVRDQALEVAVLDRPDHAAVPVQVVHDLLDPGFGRVGQGLDEVRAAEGVGDAAEPEHRRLVGLRPVALPDDRGPAAAARPVLGDLLEEVAVRAEEERDLRGELVNRHPPAGEDRVAVGDAVGEGEGHLLDRVRARVAKVSAGDGDRVKPRYLARAELDAVGDEPQARHGRPDPGAPGRVLLQYVVRDGAGEGTARQAALFRGGDVEREQDRGGAVDREAGADLVQRDLVEEELGVRERVDGDADPADLLRDLRVVGVVAALGGQVERDDQAGAALIEEVAVTPIGFLGGAEPRVLPEGPQPAPVPGGKVAPGERELARGRLVRGPVAGSVDRPHRDSGRRLFLVVHRCIRYLQKKRMPISDGRTR
jgi:hypothetical protein